MSRSSSQGFAVNSAVGKILTFLEESIELASPALTKSKHYFDFEKNPSTGESHIYAVRPARGSSTDGVTRSVTITQDFEIEISRDYYSSEADDIKLRETIDEIYKDNEKIQKEISLRKNADILQIAPPSFDAPKINENGRSVSIIFTYPVTYRKGVR